MQTMIILRAEFICAVILIYILIYSVRYSKLIMFSGYIRMCIYAILHVVFDFITVYTVNRVDEIPVMVNDICHDFFYLFAILFCYELFCYSCWLAFRKDKARVARKIAGMLTFIGVLLTILLRIDYVDGGLSYYSTGPAVFMGFGIAILYAVSSLVLLLVNRKQMNAKTVCYLTTVEIAMLAAVVVRIAVPLLLYTGAGLTCVMVGIYFSLENPAESYRSMAYVDGKTGVKNANCFQEDCEELEQQLRHYDADELCVGVMVCDLNNLKTVNDSQGHSMGDVFIYVAAQMLRENLKTAYNIYRTGGDEFVAIYIQPEEQKLEEEMQKVREECEKAAVEFHQPFGLAMGYAKTSEVNSRLEDAFNEADRRMYQNKSKIKEGI